MTTVVITGANRGLGLALAKQHLAQGATVIGGCRNPSGAAELTRAGAEVLSLDTGSGESIAAFGKALGDQAALNMLTLKQSQVLRADGVTVIAVHPGWVRSEMGGPTATLDPAESAAGLVTMVDKLTIDDTGSFLQWDGSIHPW